MSDDKAFAVGKKKFSIYGSEFSSINYPHHLNHHRLKTINVV